MAELSSHSYPELTLKKTLSSQRSGDKMIPTFSMKQTADSWTSRYTCRGLPGSSCWTHSQRTVQTWLQSSPVLPLVQPQPPAHSRAQPRARLHSQLLQRICDERTRRDVMRVPGSDSGSDSDSGSGLEGKTIPASSLTTSRVSDSNLTLHTNHSTL